MTSHGRLIPALRSFDVRTKILPSFGIFCEIPLSLHDSRSGRTPQAASSSQCKTTHACVLLHNIIGLCTSVTVHVISYTPYARISGHGRLGQEQT